MSLEAKILSLMSIKHFKIEADKSSSQRAKHGVIVNAASVLVTKFQLSVGISIFLVTAVINARTNCPGGE